MEAASSRVGRRSIAEQTWPAKPPALGRAITRGQEAMSGERVPPSWSYCLNRRKGVLDAFAQPYP